LRDSASRTSRMRFPTGTGTQLCSLANKGHDTRALQAYLGHKNIQHTVRYTGMAPTRFKDFWRRLRPAKSASLAATPARHRCLAAKREASDKWPINGGQRAIPVVVPEGLAAGGGVWLTAVDPGVPLGPGLLATCSVFRGPHVMIATASMTTAITANVRKCMRLSTLVSNPYFKLSWRTTSGHRRRC
jgi:hypothetical protein